MYTRWNCAYELCVGRHNDTAGGGGGRYVFFFLFFLIKHSDEAREEYWMKKITNIKNCQTPPSLHRSNVRRVSNRIVWTHCDSGGKPTARVMRRRRRFIFNYNFHHFHPSLPRFFYNLFFFFTFFQNRLWTTDLYTLAKMYYNNVIIVLIILRAATRKAKKKRDQTENTSYFMSRRTTRVGFAVDIKYDVRSSTSVKKKTHTHTHNIILCIWSCFFFCIQRIFFFFEGPRFDIAGQSANVRITVIIIITVITVTIYRRGDVITSRGEGGGWMLEKKKEGISPTRPTRVALCSVSR